MAFIILYNLLKSIRHINISIISSLRRGSEPRLYLDCLDGSTGGMGGKLKSIISHDIDIIFFNYNLFKPR